MANTSSHSELCAYCKKEFTPKRRWVQKYCGSACRVAASNERTGRPHPLEPEKVRARRRVGGKAPVGRTPSAVEKSGQNFQQTMLASGLGALGANAVSQTAEYLLVTKQLIGQVEALAKAVANLAAQQTAAEAREVRQFTTVANGLFTALQKLGLPEVEVRKAMRLPNAKKAEPLAEGTRSNASVGASQGGGQLPLAISTDAW